MVRREPEEEKGERGHRVTCVISVKKLDNCLRLRLVNLPSFRLGVLFPQTREYYQRPYQLLSQTYRICEPSCASTTEHSTSPVRVGTDACELIINSIKTMISIKMRGHGNLMVKVSDRGWHAMSSSRVPLKTRRVGELCTLTLLRAQTSSRWCGRERGIPAQVTFSSLNHGLKL
ncbi:uncharacterized protein TNCV_1778701 [Trichonephila clavipes]|nr:uncharacterized protein TNCV_1778701 [Trichonephila clavipes]